MTCLSHEDFLWKSRDMRLEYRPHHQSIFPSTTFSKNCWKTLHNFKKKKQNKPKNNKDLLWSVIKVANWLPDGLTDC